MALGSYLALDGVNILVEDTRKHLNTIIVFYVFNPVLVSSNISRTITYQSMVKLWVPTPFLALCKEKGSPFGDPDVCHTYGLAYASLSMAVGAIYLWSYVYNLVQIYSRSSVDSTAIKDIHINEYLSTKHLLSSLQSAQTRNDQDPYKLPSTVSEVKAQVGTTQHLGVMHHLGKLFKKLNLKALFAPSTIATIVGFAIGIIPQIRNSLIGMASHIQIQLLDSTIYNLAPPPGLQSTVMGCYMSTLLTSLLIIDGSTSIPTSSTVDLTMSQAMLAGSLFDDENVFQVVDLELSAIRRWVVSLKTSQDFHQNEKVIPIKLYINDEHTIV
ncbi:hypothetical protein UlMin_033562 [Ulmus minor]